jgi:hypothetical protein
MKRRLIGRLPFLSGIEIAQAVPGWRALRNGDVRSLRIETRNGTKKIKQAERNRTMFLTPINTD